MNSKKKILFFHHASHIGGASISGLNVLRALPADRYEIIVYCKSHGGKMADVFKKEGFNVIVAGKSPVSFLHYATDELFALSPRAILNYIRILLDKNKIKEHIDKVNPDIVIVNSMTLFWIGKIAKQAGKETICFFRETYVKGLLGLRTRIIKYYLGKYFDKISFISDYDLKQNKELKCIKKTIYNSLSPENYQVFDKDQEKQRLGLRNSDFNILYVGGLFKYKGAGIAIKALNELHRDDVKLVFVGCEWNGKKKELYACSNLKERIRYVLNLDYEKKCMDMIIKYNLSRKIKFYPMQAKMAAFYAACDALVFPSTEPHQGRPLFEAGMARIPVIVSDFPNIRENVNENSGFLFANKNTKGLAEIINRLVNNPSIARDKIEVNYVNTTNRHSPQVYKKKIVDLIDCRITL
ncbi:MAG: glycosyltransferase family 4 protein [Desulfobacterales bacterium]|nr:glycosyltransferase family 4 protein [Desulfobacterales bacterium]